jgi:hypothetical protein
LQATLNDKLSRASALTLNAAREARPKNTDDAYRPKQEEFKNWCLSNGYENGILATEEKLNLFLHEKVTPIFFLYQKGYQSAV